MNPGGSSEPSINFCARLDCGSMILVIPAANMGETRHKSGIVTTPIVMYIIRGNDKKKIGADYRPPRNQAKAGNDAQVPAQTLQD